MKMLEFLWKMILDENGTTLAITRVVANTAATAAGVNNRCSEIEAIINGGIDDSNIAADGVKAVNINPNVALADNGLAIGTGGALVVDPSDTTPALEIADGGVRVKVDGSSIERASGGLQVKAGGITLAMLAAAAKEAAWPVGSIYSNASVATNPATLLGFGTWTAIEGVVIVGYKSGDTNFGTPGASVGVATVTLTAAQSGVPAHTHPVGYGGYAAGDTNGYPEPPYNAAFGGWSGDSTNVNTAAGAAEAHTNIQPSLVAYCWKRTA